MEWNVPTKTIKDLLG